ncbi:DUF5522 domain-containing protein [Ferruginibacter paludis]|uniref:DUF5522 domain-containing protein n=1 Tax=Ferruginibacter paludis TaxID=1310417 RepID=UPI0025B4CD2C|nr:DUF5522 domain-containing protein [Ferruginibacter paludis]MDN3659336.1 DUF5522 domain-containing protein [Ferruginibacter paludis]
MRRLTEGKDFYYNEERNVVFTANYHLQRGSCCGNGCRHCPFNHCNVEDEIVKKQCRPVLKRIESNITP